MANEAATPAAVDRLRNDLLERCDTFLPPLEKDMLETGFPHVSLKNLKKEGKRYDLGPKYLCVLLSITAKPERPVKLISPVLGGALPLFLFLNNAG